VIVDNRFVIITSANFTLSDTSGDYPNPSSLGNANNLLKLHGRLYGLTINGGKLFIKPIL
jgi:phosphatidylserine/phosphatidylglycerophosphate/cardiolipin synthase-like enzyme